MNHIPLAYDVEIKVLQALHGDALRIRYLGTDLEFHNIFVDGGLIKTYRATLQEEVKQLVEREERINLFVVTHTDQDHISGVLAFIREFGEQDLVDTYWFNHTGLDTIIRSDSDKISIGEGIRLRDFLEESGKLRPNPVGVGMKCIKFAGAKLTILSPTDQQLADFETQWAKEEDKCTAFANRISSPSGDHFMALEELNRNLFREDSKLENGVSIAFLLELHNISALFLADSHPSTILRSLEGLGYTNESKLKVDFVKLSHHGSKFSTSPELLALLDCDSYIVSANGKNRYHFPHKETFARILLHPQRDVSKQVNFIFNYDNKVIRNIFTESEMSAYNFVCHYPEKGANGYTIQRQSL